MLLILLGAISKLKSQHQEDPNNTSLLTNKPALLRSLFTVGALCRHFDFDLEDFKGNSKVKILILLFNILKKIELCDLCIKK